MFGSTVPAGEKNALRVQGLSFEGVEAKPGSNFILDILFIGKRSEPRTKSET